VRVKEERRGEFEVERGRERRREGEILISSFRVSS
jgi:hypothetical protein